MSYYAIQHSLDLKVMGHYPQVEEAIYHCNVWDEPKFVDRTNFIKTDFEPIVANAILKKKAKLTDLISAGIIGFSLKLLISGKLKHLIESYRETGLQFYKSPVIYKEEYFNDYWVLNPYQIDMQNLDFQRSEIFLIENTFTKVKRLNIETVDNFNKEKTQIDKRGYPFSILIEKPRITDNVNQDFFILLNVEGGVKYVVSERLKLAIEQAECTGIEFMPIELSLNEWLTSGGERERIYGKA